MTDSTVVSVCPRRPYGFDTVTDLTDGVKPVSISRPDAAGCVAFTFDVDLDAATVEAVWARLESTDDADQAARAVLRAHRDALDAEDPLRCLYDYVLGDVAGS